VRVRTERDYYGILGVGQGATEEEIKHAYRRLALRHHPDRNPGDKRAEERFKEISEAYAVLMDPRRRREYDDLRRARAEGARPRAPRWRREDLYRDLFTDPRTASVFEELAREWAQMGLRDNEAFLRDVLFRGRGAIVIGPFGIRWVGRFGPRASAERVGGADARPTAGGDVVASMPGFLGWLWGELRQTVGAPLRAISGKRARAAASRRGDLQYEIAVTAADLHGGGRYRVMIQRAKGKEELLVRVPPGLRPGARLRLRGKGDPGPDGTPGDLFLHVRVKS
jgi:curved DNA-binding protein CbpA